MVVVFVEPGQVYCHRFDYNLSFNYLNIESVSHYCVLKFEVCMHSCKASEQWILCQYVTSTSSIFLKLISLSSVEVSPFKSKLKV